MCEMKQPFEWCGQIAHKIYEITYTPEQVAQLKAEIEEKLKRDTTMVIPESEPVKQMNIKVAGRLPEPTEGRA